MSTVYNKRAKSYLTAAVSDSAVNLLLPLPDYPLFLSGHSAGDHFHAILIDIQYSEIVKVTITGSNQATGLLVERGQQGTSARDWAAGTLIYQDITAADLDLNLQKGVFRTIAFNPNGVTVPDYAGEKVYQSDLALWWMSVDAVNTTWRLIAGEITVADPTVSPVDGGYVYGQLCTLETTTVGADIYYTTDGSTPDENSTLYSAPFTIPIGTVDVKAIAVHTDRWYTDSGVVTGEYLVVATFESTVTANLLIDPATAAKFFMSRDGSVIYLGMSGALDRTFQIPLSTPFDVFTHEVNTGTEEAPSWSDYNDTLAGDELYVSIDGLYAYAFVYSTQVVTQYSLTTPFDITAISLVGASTSLVTLTPEPADGYQFGEGTYTPIHMSNDGSRLYSIYYYRNAAGDRKYVPTQFALSTPFDITTAAWEGVASFFWLLTDLEGARTIRVNDDGTLLYIGHSYDEAGIEVFEMPTAWDLESAVSPALTTFYPTQEITSYSFVVNPTSGSVYEVAKISDEIHIMEYL